MADVIFPNVALASANHAFSGIWKLSRALKKAGWTYKASSDGSAKDTTGTAANDKWGGDADPALDAYPAGLDAVSAWWNAEGPKVLRVPIIAATTGTFARGEKITQAVSLAEGELLGVEYSAVVFTADASTDFITTAGGQEHNLWNGATVQVSSTGALPAGLAAATTYFVRDIDGTGTKFKLAATRGGAAIDLTTNGTGTLTFTAGFLVVMPRTGTFNGTNVITGAASAATSTPAATPESFVCEIVIWKSTTTLTGSFYYQRVSDVDENASRFSVIAGAAAGCTATVAPGGGGTGNAFPSAGSYVVRGTTAPVHHNWGLTTNLGKAQVIAANATGAADTTPDGSFQFIQGDTSAPDSLTWFGLQRLDDTEEGDLDPFSFFWASGLASGNANERTDASDTAGSLSASDVWSTARADWRGWRRRGFATNDAFIACSSCLLYLGQNAGTILSINTANPETIATGLAKKTLRERLKIVSNENTKKMRKGAARWVVAHQSGAAFDTWDTFKWVQLLGSNPSISVGPYDGASTPLQV